VAGAHRAPTRTIHETCERLTRESREPHDFKPTGKERATPALLRGGFVSIVSVVVLSPTGTFALRPIAETGDRFRDFAPYVPSLNNEGVVAFKRR